jgi:hypothetical protein
MADASIWQPGSGIPLLNADKSYVYELVIAEAGQRVFDITEFKYVLNTNSLQVIVQGLDQILDVDFTETTTTSFTFVDPLVGGERVLICGFVGAENTASSADSAAASAASAAASAASAVESADSAADSEASAQVSYQYSENSRVSAQEAAYTLNSVIKSAANLVGGELRTMQISNSQPSAVFSSSTVDLGNLILSGSEFSNENVPSVRIDMAAESSGLSYDFGNLSLV